MSPGEENDSHTLWDTWIEEVNPHHFLWKRATSATQMLPTTDRCPSQQHRDHTQQSNRALAVLHPGNYTLGNKPASSSRRGLNRAQGEQEKWR